MMIMHEPDKKTRRKWLSEPLLHFSEPADWRGESRGGEKKKGVFLLWDWSRLGVCCLKDSRYNPGCAPRAGTWLWKRAELSAAPALAQTSSFVTPGLQSSPLGDWSALLAHAGAVLGIFVISWVFSQSSGFSVDPAPGELLCGGGWKHSVCFHPTGCERWWAALPSARGGVCPSASPVDFWENRPL